MKKIIDKFLLKERIIILNNIFGYFQQITQWLPNNMENCAEYQIKAEALIEYLEVLDCGSTGGFDKKSPVKWNESRFLLYDRFLALVRLYSNEKDIEKVCHFDLETLKQYFIKLSELRQSFNV
jgi:hypothetical protein